ncbi:MAG: hypothetical protein ACRDJ1_12845 [Actinomycetota bacterium]
MSIGRIGRALRDEESGFAMIVAVVLLGVMGTLMALVMTVGSHTTFATARGRSWVQALHVAEAGVHRAIAKLEETNGTFTGTFTGTTDEGNFTATVTPKPRKRFQIDVAGVVEPGEGLGATRRIRVTMAPPSSFLYAMLSNTSIATKGGDVIDGDIWSNQNVLLEQGNIVHGAVTAATGWVATKNGVTIDEDVWTGGYDPNNQDRSVHLEAGGTIGGNVKASVTAPPDPITCGGEDPTRYKVRVEGTATVAGNVTTWGPKTGSGTVQGTISQNVCTNAPPTKSLPTFTYSAANYDSSTHHEFGTADTPSATAIADFQAHIIPEKSAMSGSYYINQSGFASQDLRIDLTNVVVAGDTTIVSNVPIYANGLTDSAGDALLTLVSTYQPPTGSICDVNQDNSECSIHLKNNFEPSGNTAVIIYAPYGPVAVKNNQVQFGTIYADAIQIKNNQTLTYDSRVERVVGFGDVTYEVETWIELAP